MAAHGQVSSEERRGFYLKKSEWRDLARSWQNAASIEKGLNHEGTKDTKDSTKRTNFVESFVFFVPSWLGLFWSGLATILANGFFSERRLCVPGFCLGD
jgi:hypothetical protein